MALHYKINVLDALKASGYNTTKIRKEQLLSESTLQKLRTGEGIAWKNIETICRLLDCQPGDFIEFIKD